MSILVGENTRLVVQGITGKEGSFHARACKAYGTNLVAGVTPGRGGQIFDETVPVFDSMDEAVGQTGANTSLIFVPPPFAAEAVIEAVLSGVGLVICITEGVPVMDTVRVVRFIEHRPVTLIGPNCPGLITPAARCKVGIMPGAIHKPGRMGLVSRSGTLTYEAVGQLTGLGIGQTTCVGVGGDPLVGTGFVEVLRLFQDDPETEMVTLIGEIGGSMEQEAAEFIRDEMTKPVAALIAGATAPQGKRMGHAGAVITGEAATASAKTEALRRAGARIIPTPAHIGVTVKAMMDESPR